MPKTLLITGGSSGIGLACVTYFLQNGWNVFSSYHSNQLSVKELAKSYSNFDFMQLNCSNSKMIQEFTNRCINRFGGIDAAVSSAGITAVNQIQDISDEELKYVFETNFYGTFYLFREVAKHFIPKKQGKLVAISSINAEMGGSCETHYSSSKAAINGLVASLSQELITSGITVNAISPGIVDTSMNDGYNKDDLIAHTPLGRLCEPTEIASTTYFLCNDGSRFVTGQVIVQDGAVNF